GTRCQVPETVTNALGQATTIQHRYDFLLPTKVKDPNTIEVSVGYDDFGRLQDVYNADGTRAHRAYASCDASNNHCAVTDLREHIVYALCRRGAVFVTPSSRYLDLLGRLRYAAAYRADHVWTYDTLIMYDTLGRPTVTYQPFSAGVNGYETHAYDPLGRIT